jgi:hypothetical protein
MPRMIIETHRLGLRITKRDLEDARKQVEKGRAKMKINRTVYVCLECGGLQLSSRRDFLEHVSDEHVNSCILKMLAKGANFAAYMILPASECIRVGVLKDNREFSTTVIKGG